MEDIPTKITGDTLTADEWNNIPDEVKNIIESVGITLSGADRFQLAKAVATYAASGDFYSDGGAANAYVLSPIGNFKVPVQYHEGMRIRFLASHTNTTASTVNVNGIGVIPIKKDEAGTALSGSEIRITAIIELTYRTTPSTFFEITSVKLATEAHPGIIQIATAAEVLAATNLAKAVVPGHMINQPGLGKVVASWTQTGTTTVTQHTNHSLNVTSIIATAKGRVTVNYGVTFADAFPAITTGVHGISFFQGNTAEIISSTATSLELATYDKADAAVSTTSAIVVTGKLA